MRRYRICVHMQLQWKTKGIQQGIQQGEERKPEDNIKQLAEYFMSQDDKLTKEEATQMAKGILK